MHVDAQTLNEIELPAFESAIDAGAGAVMCAYNKVNGAFSCENPALLTDILRGRWGFDGFVVSDYGANHSTSAARVLVGRAQRLGVRARAARDLRRLVVA